MSNARELAELGGAYSTGGYPHFKNRIINGAMMIDQRNAGASVTIPSTLGQYTLDRWVVQSIGASKFSIQQTPSATETGYATRVAAGFTNYLALTSLAATSASSGDYYALIQRIEGFNFSDVAWGTANAKPVTLSFLVYSSLTGTFSGSLKNATDARSYPFTFTVSSANTWTSVSVNIAGDTSGAWVVNNGVGVVLTFDIGAGSSYRSSSANAWQAGNYYGVTGAVSVLGTSGATFYITGVQLEKGSTATAYDYRPYGTELALCQRYYQQYYGPGAGTVMLARNNAGAANQGPALNIFHKVPMRATPTGTIVGTWTVVNCAQPIFASGNNETATIYQNSTGSGDCYFMPVATTSGWTLSAEL